MAETAQALRPGQNQLYWQERVDLAAAFQWTVHLNMHEAVANHFSLAVGDHGEKMLMNPDQMHFARIRASDMLLLDLDDKDALSGPDKPDETAWWLHGAIHRECPHAKCVMHIHSIFSTVLASLVDSRLPPIDQNSAMFFDRYVIDDDYGGLALEEEGKRCADLLGDPKKKVMIMGNHGLLVIGASVAETFDRMFYFERAAETYIRALQTGHPLRILSDEVAEKTAHEIENYGSPGEKHFSEIKLLLDANNADYAQ